MHGLHLVIYVHKSIYDNIKIEDKFEIRTGLLGIYGNKGGIAIRLKLLGTSLLFVNCHLESG